MKKQAMAEKDLTIAEKDSALIEKDHVITEKDHVITEKDRELSEKTQEATDLRITNANLEHEKNRMLEELASLRQLFKNQGIVLDEDEPRVSRVSFLREQRQTDSHDPVTHDTIPTPER